LELTNPDPSKVAVEAHQEKTQQQQQSQKSQEDTNWLNRVINWFF
jgi:hypothetical protein